MMDLSRWDRINKFTAKEAAALILGYDPIDPEAPLWKTVPVLKEMRAAYEDAVMYVVVTLNQYEGDPNAVSLDTEGLEFMGESLQSFYISTPKFDEQIFGPLANHVHRFSEWFDSCEKFSRPEIVRWLAAKGIKSDYEFDLTRMPGLSLEDRQRLKLSESQVAEIRSKLHAGSTQAALAREYGVSRRTIQNYTKDETMTTKKTKKKGPAIFCSGLGSRGATR